MRTTSPAALMASRGSGEITTSPQTAAAIRDLFAVAHRFFASDLAEREAIQANGSMTGWRRVGVEYSQSPDRPDLNETFCLRRADDATSPSHELIDAARAAQSLLDDHAAAVLADLADVVGHDYTVPVRTSNESWLQLNYSHPSTAGREFIQEAHEDGHLITLLVADAPGLEVHEPATGWRAVLPTAEQPICFGGECGALLSGDAIHPTPHQVRALSTVPTRLSMAYFVNPDLDQELAPWVPMRRSVGVDLLRWGQQNPARFGLPTL